MFGRMGRPVQHDRCTMKDCGADHYAKGLCRAHYQKQRSKSIDQKMGMKPRKKRMMLSVCCSKETMEGPAHDYGSQYCGKCKQPCYWRYNFSL